MLLAHVKEAQIYPLHCLRMSEDICRTALHITRMSTSTLMKRSSYACRTKSADLMAAMEYQPVECLACLGAAAAEVMGHGIGERGTPIL